MDLRKPADLIGKAVRARVTAKPKAKPRAASRPAAGAPIDHPLAPAGARGPGCACDPQPLGLDDPFASAIDAQSPAAMLDWRAPRDAQATTLDHTGSVIDAPESKPAKKDRLKREEAARKAEARRQAEQKRAGTPEWMRDRLGSDSVEAVRAAVKDPSLNATMGQKVSAEQLAQAARAGDRQRVKEMFADLIGKLDVTSPEDSAVLMADGVSSGASGEVQRLLGRGKTTLEMTQGGRLLSRVASPLQQYSTIDLQGEVNGAWAQLSQKFAGQAKGRVDVVLGRPETPKPGDAIPGGATLPQTPQMPQRPQMPKPPAIPGAGDIPKPPAGATAEHGRRLVFKEVDAADPSSLVREAAAPPERLVLKESAKLPLREVTAPGEHVSSGIAPITLQGEGRKLSLREVEDAAGSPVGESVPERLTLKDDGSSITSIKMREITPASAAPDATTPHEAISLKRGAKLAMHEVESAAPTPVGSASPASGVEAIDFKKRSDLPLREVIDQAPEGAREAGAPPIEKITRLGSRRIAGGKTLAHVLETNPGITEVNVQEVVPSETPGKSTLKSVGSAMRSALLQKFGQ